jgi:transposase
MHQQITIKTLHKQNKTNQEIASTMGCHRNTVSNVLKRDQPIDKIVRNKDSVFTPYWDAIKNWLENDQLTMTRIHEKLTEEYEVSGSYDALRRFVRKNMPKRIEAFGVQEHLPGDEVEIDFGDIHAYLQSEQRTVKYQLLAFILPYSGKRYYELCDNQKLETFCRAFEQAFTFYGGVPRKIKTDNLKAAVCKNTHYALEFNQNFLEFANHYGSIVNPCTPYTPQQKGAVEGSVKYAQRNFVPGRTFQDRQDVAKQLEDWITTINGKIHSTTKEVINDRFAQEKDKLQALPSEPFAFFNCVQRTVGLNCHIHFDGNYYSVPFNYVTKIVSVRWNDSILRIIYQGEEIALHRIAAGRGHYVTNRVHLPSDKIYSETEYQLKHETKMRRIGECGHEYFTLLLAKQPGYWRQTVRSIYGLAEQYGNEALDKALKRALSYGALDTRTIRHILENKLYDIEESLALPEFSAANSRDLEYYR